MKSFLRHFWYKYTVNSLVSAVFFLSSVSALSQSATPNPAYEKLTEASKVKLNPLNSSELTGVVNPNTSNVRSLSKNESIYSNTLRKEGTQGSGGGDSLSKRINHIRYLLGDNGELVRPMLRQIGINLMKFASDFNDSTSVQSLIKRGLLNGIQDAPYELKASCVDQDGIERSASTLNVDRSLNPDISAPSICINIRKLAFENANLNEILGLLYHEHARHYGVWDDLDQFGSHPIANYITTRANGLLSKELTNAVALGNGTAVFYEPSTYIDYPERMLVIFPDVYPPKLVISEVQGKLEENSNVYKYRTWLDGLTLRYESKKEILGQIHKGMEYEIPFRTHLGHLSFENIGGFFFVNKPELQLSLSILSHDGHMASIPKSIRVNSPNQRKNIEISTMPVLLLKRN